MARKFGDSGQVVEAYHRGRRDAAARKPQDVAFKHHRNKAIARAYLNGYREGQSFRSGA
jgi:hypothetical protein